MTDESSPQNGTSETRTRDGGGDGARPTAPRRSQFLISSQQRPGVQPLSLDLLAQSLGQSPDIEVVRTLEPRGVVGVLSDGMAPAGTVIVARMTDEKAEVLRQSAGPQLTVEPDAPLTLGAPEPFETAPPAFEPRNPGVIVPLAAGFTATIEVRGNDTPLQGAEVYLFGSLWPAQGVTGADGRVTLTLLADTADTIHGLYVKPRVDFWSYYLANPQLAPNAVSRVDVTPLSSSFANFPNQQIVGWGQRAMRTDQLGNGFTGRGVRVAVVDSGAAARTHRDLARIAAGYDNVQDNPNTWVNDEIGHGSHCAGVIAATAEEFGIRGVAPEAEIHAFKLFPGGRFSNLIEALDYCMQNDIDVVNLSLGSSEASQLVYQRILRAKQMGIACIVAAGNSGGQVLFPGSVPDVLTVSAIGRWGEFPDDSYHATQSADGAFRGGPGGYFFARFSCFGPEVDVCAPGVAVVSCLPPNNFAAWDGTSMATPHVAGLAALILAHHPDFRTTYSARNAARVERLFQIIKETAQPLNLGDRNRTGAGLPDAVTALNPQAVLPAGMPLAAGQIEEIVRQVLRGAIQTGAQPQAAPALAALLSPQAAAIPAAGAAGATPGSTIEQLRALMQQAGLGAARQAPTRASAVPRGPARTTSAPLTPAPQAAAPPSGGPAPGLRELEAAMQRSGLR